MKKTIFTILLLAGMASQVRAQEQGRFWIGGSLGFNNRTEESTLSAEPVEERSYKYHSYSIQPELGYAFSDRWAAGIRLGFGQSKDEYVTNYERDRRYKTFQVAPFVRYTCLSWRKFSVFVDGGLSYGQYKEDDIPYIEDPNDSHRKQNRYGVFLQPGFSLRLSSCIALTGRLNFLDVSYEKYELTSTSVYGTTDTDSNQFYANLNSPFSVNNFTVGFNFSF